MLCCADLALIAFVMGVRELTCKGATLLVSWQEYRFAPPGGYGNSFL